MSEEASKPARGRVAAGARGGARGAAAARRGGPRQGGGGTEPKLIIKKFSPVYLSKSISNNETCAICRNELGEPCTACSVKSLVDCQVSQGKCGHEFHTHCLEQWLPIKRICPVCNLQWEYA